MHSNKKLIRSFSPILKLLTKKYGIALALGLLIIFSSFQQTGFAQIGYGQRTKYKFGDYIQFGRLELEKGNYTAAIRYLNSAVEQRPASYEGYFLRGIAKYYLDDYFGAEMDFTESAKYDPYNAEIFHFRAIVRSSQYNLGGAMQDYARAIELNPKNPLFYLNRARGHLFLQVYDSAIVDCNRTYELDYRTEQVFIIRGIAYREIENYEMALKDFDRAIRKNPENTNSFVQRGTVYMDLNKPDSAILDFNKAIIINGDDTYAIFHRGLARMETSDTTGAFEDLNKVISLSPRNSYAYYNRAILYIGRSEIDLALDDLDKVVALNPDNIVVFLYRGRIKRSTGDLEGAVYDFTKAIEIYPEFADAYYERSQVKKEMLDFDGAEDDYQLAFAINEFNFQRTDSLKLQEEMYLRRLMAFSGEFTDNSEPSDRLQDQSVDIELQPVYSTVLFAKSMEGIRFYDTFSKGEYNATLLSMTNDPGMINTYLAQVELDKLNDSLASRKVDWEDYLKRAQLKYEIRDYSSALEDFDAAILTQDNRAQSYFGRANTLLKLIELTGANMDEYYLFDASTDFDNPTNVLADAAQEYTYEDVVADYNVVIELDPSFHFAWYNRGYVKAMNGDYWGAIRDFTKAIELDPEFAAAYYNKGLLLVYQNLKTVGCRDLSMAGELGIANSYPVMKRFCVK